MKKPIFKLVLGISIFSQAFAQNEQNVGGGSIVTTYSEKFQASYGGMGDDGGNFSDLYYCDLKTISGGFIFGGMSNSPVGGNRTAPNKGGYDYWIIKTDQSGNKIWDKAYGGSGDDKLQQILPTSDGGYLLAGQSSSGVDGDKTKTLYGSNDAWFIKIDANGNKLWDQAYGGNSLAGQWSGRENVVKNIFEVNGKYYIGISSGSSNSGNKTVVSKGAADYGIIALNANNGNIVFEKGYGGSENDDLHSIYVKNDGSFILFGSSQSGISGNKTTAALGDWDYWVISCDANGQVLWNKSFGGNGNDFFADAKMLKKSDGTTFFVMSGDSNSMSNIAGKKSENSHGDSDIWLVAIDNNGNKLWDHTYGGTEYDAPTSIDVHLKQPSFAFLPAYHDQIIVSGFSNSNAYMSANGYKTENNMGPSDGWVVFINASDGQQFKDISLGGNGDDATIITKAIDVDIIKGDIDYVSLSFTATGISGNKTIASFGGYDMWIRTLSKKTYNTNGTSQISTNNNQSNFQQSSFVDFYPTIIKSGDPINILLDCPTSNDELTTFNANVYNMSGEMVFTSKLTNDQPNSITTKFPSAGIYLINITDQNNQVIHQQKINVIK